jgi:hypothetical protein
VVFFSVVFDVHPFAAELKSQQFTCIEVSADYSLKKRTPRILVRRVGGHVAEPTMLVKIFALGIIIHIRWRFRARALEESIAAELMPLACGSTRADGVSHQHKRFPVFVTHYILLAPPPPQCSSTVRRLIELNCHQLTHADNTEFLALQPLFAKG